MEDICSFDDSYLENFPLQWAEEVENSRDSVLRSRKFRNKGNSNAIFTPSIKISLINIHCH